MDRFGDDSRLCPLFMNGTNSSKHIHCSSTPMSTLPTRPFNECLSYSLQVRHTQTYKRLPPFFRDWAARERARAAELRGTMGGEEEEGGKEAAATTGLGFFGTSYDSMSIPMSDNPW